MNRLDGERGRNRTFNLLIKGCTLTPNQQLARNVLTCADVHFSAWTLHMQCVLYHVSDSVLAAVERLGGHKTGHRDERENEKRRKDMELSA